MPRVRETFDLEEWVITVYAALDDALKEAGVAARGGKLVPRPGPAPDVDDREVLGLAVLQALLGFESDHAFYQWFESNAVLRQLFPRRLTRSNWADRRERLGGLVQRGYCASLERWFHRVRDHLVCTPGGRISIPLCIRVSALQ